MDMQKAIKYFQVLAELPEEVDIFLQSKLFSSFIKDLDSSYSLPEGYLTDLTIDLITEKFNEKIVDGLLEKFSHDLKLQADRNEKLLLDYFGYILLPLSPYVTNLDVRNRITRLGGDPREYKDKTDAFQRLIEDYAFDEIDKIYMEREKNFDVKKDEMAIENMFRSELLYMIQNPEPELNGAVISILFADENFKNILFKHIVGSQQLLFSREIYVDGKRFLPTIGNWINDFMAVKSGAYFNNLTLSDYVTNSKYSRGLDNEEKDLLIKLLTLYRNIRFFPRSLQDLTPDKWEIFPLEKSAKAAMESRQTLAAPKSPEEIEIENLEKMAAGYQLGSLERRAVEEEIRKMKLSIKYTGVKR